MIDYQFVLMIVFLLALIAAYILGEQEGISKGLVYTSGFGFFFIGMNITINGITEVSLFLTESVGIVLWALGVYLLLVPVLNEISEE